MNKLHQAYIELGLQPGAPLQEVLERWRTVARMWHPDRAGTPEEKAIAESELKKINAARDLLARHFQKGEHRSSACECSLNTAGGVPPGYRSDESGRYSRAETSEPPPQDRRSNAPSGANAGNAAAGRAPGSTASRRNAVREADAKLVVLATISMVVLGASLVRMNSGIHIKQPAEQPAYDFPGTAYNTTPLPATPSRSVIGFAQLVREPQSSTASNGAAAKSAGSQSSQAKSTETKSSELTADSSKTQTSASERLPSGGSQSPRTITFVSSDGRLVSLQDGSTWELYGAEAADSFFQWQPGDRITVKGLNSYPSWLVNESRGYQAVRVSEVK